jgi:carbon monoxide dehydrogenase subunit G
MATIESSISIGKPVEQVFQFLADLQNQKVLNPMTAEVVVAGKPAVGTKFKTKGRVMARDFETDNEIVAFEPNLEFGFKTHAPPPASDVTSVYRFEREGSGTRLHLAMDIPILTGGVPGLEGMVRSQVKTGLDAGLTAIKNALEG